MTPNHDRSARPRILVVDDDASICRLLETMLEDDYHVGTAATGGEAIHLARSEPPDLMLLDLDLPDIRGVDVLRAMREEAILRDIPVVVISGYDGPEIEVLDAGADDYVRKPLHEDPLKARMAHVLRRPRREDG